MSNPLQESIDSFENLQKTFDEVVENSQAVKDGKVSAEDVCKEPAYLLYKSINDTCINIIKDEKVADRFQTISGGLGVDVTKALIELLTIIMTHSAYESICLYDELLKTEITKQFNVFGNNLNVLKSITDAHESVLKVFKEKLNKIESAETINKFNKENNISD